MSLDIVASDGEKNFHIGYFGFTTIRSYFILHCGKRLYDDYEEICKSVLSFRSCCSVDEERFDKQLGNLRILINHSDCDGELSSTECKKLRPCLFVDEDKIKSLEEYSNNPEYNNQMIAKMYEFIDLINYCADKEDVKLIFG